MPSILIIDDDVTLLSRLGLQLEEAGFEVAKSSDLGHGEQLYVEQRPDLVLLEVRSGNNKGWDLLGRLAAETPVLVLSGTAREEDVVRALEEGAADFVAKPYRSAELLARIRLRMAEPAAAPAPFAAQPAPSPRAGKTATPSPRPEPASAATPSPRPEPASAATPASAAPTGSMPEPAPTEAPATPPAPRSEPVPAAPARTAATVTASVSTTTPLSTTSRKSRRGPVIDESVFMSEAEEMALLRTPAMPPSQRPAETPAPDVTEGGLGQHLRAERLRRHLTLVQVENDLKIRMSYLQAMEDEKFALLPRGPAAPQMVKDYTSYLGIDAGPILGELQAQSQSEPAAPMPALGGTPLPRTFPRWAIILLAVLLALAVCVGAIIIFDPGFFARLPAFFQGLWAQITGVFGGG